MAFMITICYYISDYGYGHAARSIAVIRRLAKQSQTRLRLIVCSSRSLGFIKESLKDCREAEIEYRSAASDLGYCLKAGSIEPDLELLKLQYTKYIAAFPEEVDRECIFLRQNKVSLVISDISPFPLLAANLVNVRTVGLSNFTWFTAYKQMLNEPLLEPLYEAYSQMDYFIALPGSGNEPPWGRLGGIRTDFFCRRSDDKELDRLRKEIQPDRSGMIVFFALGMSITVDDLSELSLWEDESCRFIVSSNMAVDRANVIRIPEGYTESQHYVAISDMVITKPGWGTVSEAVMLNKPLILLDRSLFAEDRNTIEALNGRHPYRLMGWGQLKHADIKEPVPTYIGQQGESQASSEFPQDAVQDISDFIGGLVM